MKSANALISELLNMLHPKVCDTPIETVTAVDVFNLVLGSAVTSGYSAAFVLKPHLQHKYGAQNPVIRIKDGNNGGYGFYTPPEEGPHPRPSNLAVDLLVSLNGQKVTITCALDELETIVLERDGEYVIDLASVVGMTFGWMVSASFNSEPESISIQKRAAATAERANDPKVVSLFKRD